VLLLNLDPVDPQKANQKRIGTAPWLAASKAGVTTESGSGGSSKSQSKTDRNRTYAGGVEGWGYY
jgi:hypothetical protein